MSTSRQSRNPEIASEPTSVDIVRFAGVLVLAAAFAVGIWAAAGVARTDIAVWMLTLVASPEGFWAFLLVATTPVGFGVLLLLQAESMRDTRTVPAIADWGQAAGFGVVAAGVAGGIWAATAAFYDAFWAFLVVATVPLGVGTTVVLKAVSLQKDFQAAALKGLGLAIGLIVIAAAFAIGVWVSSNVGQGLFVFGLPIDVHEQGALVFFMFASWPAGVGLLVFVMTAELYNRTCQIEASSFGLVVGLALAFLGVVLALWLPLTVSQDGYVPRDVAVFLGLNAGLYPFAIGLAVGGASVSLRRPGNDAAKLAWLGTIAVFVVTSAVAGEAGIGYDEGFFWVFLSIALVPVAVAFTLAASAETCRLPQRQRDA